MPNTPDPLIANLKQKIAQFGHVVMGIGGGGPCIVCGDGTPHSHEGEVTFSYTVGLSAKGFPELIVFTLDPRDAMRILNHLAAMMKRTNLAFVHGQRVSLGGRYPLLAIEADKAETWHNYVTMPRRVYQKQVYPVVQILAPDTTGRFPPNCDKPFSDATILSSRYPPSGY